MNVKSDTEYIAKTGHTIDPDGSIPLNIKSELVRCKDCVHWIATVTHSTMCDKYEPDAFCSHGERKEE